MRKYKNGVEKHVALPNYKIAAFCGLDVRDFTYREWQTLQEAKASSGVCEFCVVEIERRIAVAEEAPPWGAV